VVVHAAAAWAWCLWLLLALAVAPSINKLIVGWSFDLAGSPPLQVPKFGVVVSPPAGRGGEGRSFNSSSSVCWQR
jgi:hypothetical protein